jgi:pimeloyl-ACP methyl ester carboxylesterase
MKHVLKANALSLWLMLTIVVVAQNEAKGNYAEVNGLKMYYEIHGAGQPLVVLHGAYMTISTMGEIIPELAKTRQVIAVELQGHGHTADINRPLSTEYMADDVAVLLKQLEINQADVFGYSMGGGVALDLAVRYPELVRKLVVAAVAYNNEGYYPEMLTGIEGMTPEMLEGTPWKEDYNAIAPRPEDFPTLVAKLKEHDLTFPGWSPETLSSIKASALYIVGDSDMVRPEHAAALFRLLGGGVPGDLTGLPNVQLAVLPGTTHIGVITRVDWLISMMTPFLDAPMPESQ